jgi:hypothetical protein
MAGFDNKKPLIRMQLHSPIETTSLKINVLLLHKINFSKYLSLQY